MKKSPKKLNEGSDNRIDTFLVIRALNNQRWSVCVGQLNDDNWGKLDDSGLRGAVLKVNSTKHGRILFQPKNWNKTHRKKFPQSWFGKSSCRERNLFWLEWQNILESSSGTGELTDVFSLKGPKVGMMESEILIDGEVDISQVQLLQCTLLSSITYWTPEMSFWLEVRSN